MQPHNAMQQTPPDSPYKPAFGRARRLMQRVLEGRRLSEAGPETLEEWLCRLSEELTLCGAEFRVFITGKSRALKPAIQEQIYLIGREAVINALHHSRAAGIEVEVDYSRPWFRMVVRDDGCGIDPKILKAELRAHQGLLEMHERAENMGARLRIWSRPGAGTEVEISIPSYIAAETSA
jgi:signal transduction histidine kinase